MIHPLFLREAEFLLMPLTKRSLGEIPSDKIFFRIGEVSRIVGVQSHVIRFWETEFPAIKPKKSSSRHRLYRRQDVETILAIKRLLYEEKYTIAGARQRLSELMRQEKTPLAEIVGEPPAPRRRMLALVPQQQPPHDPLQTIREELESFLRFLDEDEKSQHSEMES